MAKVELKKPVVDEIAQSIDGAASVILVNYSGLTVEQDTKLRKELREAGVAYKVYKNTMMNLAFKDTPLQKKTPQRLPALSRKPRRLPRRLNLYPVSWKAIIMIKTV